MATTFAPRFSENIDSLADHPAARTDDPHVVMCDTVVRAWVRKQVTLDRITELEEEFERTDHHGRDTSHISAELYALRISLTEA